MCGLLIASCMAEKLELSVCFNGCCWIYVL